MCKKTVLIASIVKDTLANGPGLRDAIFCQTCYHNCKGCFNPHTHSPNEGVRVPIVDIVEDVINNPLTSGVTFSGGDPFEQSEEFYEIAKQIKSKTKKDIWCYTGYTFEEILENQSKKQLLNCIDVLVDGKFDIELLVEGRLYGSSNQRVINVKESLKENRIIKYKI